MSLERLAAAIPAPQDLDAGEVLGYWALCYHANDDGFVYETNADLARWMHYREPTAVSRVLGRLEAKGYIERHQDRHGRVIFLLDR